MKKINLVSCSLAVVLFAATFSAAGQSVLININEANPSAVQFVATSANSFANSSVYNLFGVDLISYFTNSTPPVVSGAATGNLIPAGIVSQAYTAWIPDSLNTASNVDLNLYNTSNPLMQTFTTTGPAFSGTAVINLSSLLADLPHTGATGNIYSGNVNSPGALIGTWVVVPEPSVEAQVALGAMVFAGLAFFRRARRVAARR